MQRLKLTIAMLAALSGSACTQWTDPGRGGAAEAFPAVMETDDPLVEIEQRRELRQDLNHVQRHLDVLVIRGARDCLPAAVHLAELREARIAREIGGGLLADAGINLVEQRLALVRLENQLTVLTDVETCAAGIEVVAEVPVEPIAATQDDDATSTELETLYWLLNSDNQFALNSDRINPKYADNLARACNLLQRLPGVRLTVIGHADASGDMTVNEDLSARRAAAVVDYLHACPVEPTRISQASHGAGNPLYPGRSPSIDLVNRRVSVELVVNNNPGQE